MNKGELLYNGIHLPAEWPPRDQIISPLLHKPELGIAYGVDDARDFKGIKRDPQSVPWLENPPAVIPIDVGRQLFVDDFLIQETTLDRKFHLAEKFADNPVLSPETEWEAPAGHLTGAAPKSGGVWWDSKDQIFKMWYEGGWCEASAYATSHDGIRWERPSLDVVPGTNCILPEITPDSTTVFLDDQAIDSGSRFKMLLRPPGSWSPGLAMVSPDGIHWSKPVETGTLNDRSTMFYNPFRRRWIYSIRSLAFGRTRHYHEHPDFLAGAAWKMDEPVYWTGADDLDAPDPQYGYPTQLYNLDAVAYESLMIGLFEIHRGPSNPECARIGTPKITELTMAYSRDGFHWHRPDRRAFISASREPGFWDRGYVQSVGGVCTIVGDDLRFYYSACRGGDKDQDPEGGMYNNRATGLAHLRRDGFASMNAGDSGGVLRTRPVTFTGAHLFVNAACSQGSLKVAILTEDGRPIAPFTADACRSFSGDSTKTPLAWDGAPALSELAGRRVRFEFHLTRGDLYAFWVSPDAEGSSRGYVAAGGPAYRSSADCA